MGVGKPGRDAAGESTGCGVGEPVASRRDGSVVWRQKVAGQGCRRGRGRRRGIVQASQGNEGGGARGHRQLLVVHRRIDARRRWSAVIRWNEPSPEVRRRGPPRGRAAGRDERGRFDRLDHRRFRDLGLRERPRLAGGAGGWLVRRLRGADARSHLGLELELVGPLHRRQLHDAGVRSSSGAEHGRTREQILRGQPALYGRLEQRAPEGPRVVRSLLGLLGEILHHHCGDGLGHVGGARDTLERRRQVVDLLHEECHRLVAIERRSPRQHLVDHGRDGIDVPLRRHLLAHRPLGRDVSRRAEDEARGRGHRLLAPVEARDAEVQHLHVVRIVRSLHEHDVLRLEIAMDDPLYVRLARGVAELQRDMKDARQRHRAADRCNGALERQTVQVLHHDVERAVGELTGEKHVNDVGVRQARRHLGLPMKTRDQHLVGRELAMQDFHRDVAVDALLKGAVHAAHRADADQLANLDVPQDLAGEVRVGRGGGGDDAARGRERRAVERAIERVGGVACAARRTGLRRRGLRGLTHGGHASSWRTGCARRAVRTRSVSTLRLCAPPLLSPVLIVVAARWG